MKQKVLKFETKVDEVKCKETIENEKEFRIVLKTMDRRSGKLQGEVGNWGQIEYKFLRKSD